VLESVENPLVWDFKRNSPVKKKTAGRFLKKKEGFLGPKKGQLKVP